MTKTRLLAGTAKVIECGSEQLSMTCHIESPYAIIECNGEKVRYGSPNAARLNWGQKIDTFMAFITEENRVRRPFIQWNPKNGSKRKQIGNQPKNKELNKMFMESVGLL